MITRVFTDKFSVKIGRLDSFLITSINRWMVYMEYLVNKAAYAAFCQYKIPPSASKIRARVDLLYKKRLCLIVNPLVL